MGSAGKKTGVIARNVVVMSTDDAFGKTASKSIHGGLTRFKIESLADFYYPVKASDLAVEIANLAAKNPNVWFFTSKVNDVVLITRPFISRK